MPANAMGISVTVLTINFLIPVYAAMARNSHSVSDDMYHMSVYTNAQPPGGNGLQKKQADSYINEERF